jgi:hypothetical protein
MDRNGNGNENGGNGGGNGTGSMGSTEKSSTGKSSVCYIGRYDEHGEAQVIRMNQPGDPHIGTLITPDRSQDIINHSPDGFAWGYIGSGPAQLALALILDATNDEHTALNCYQWFKMDRLSGLNRAHGWVITRDEILEYVESRAALARERFGVR